MELKTTRFSGADWADQLVDITLVGLGGIGSWTALNLSRIGHTLSLIDYDMVDETNVSGGQMFRKDDVGKYKVYAVNQICRDFGTTNMMIPVIERFDPEMGTFPVTITGLDDMDARRLVFESWRTNIGALDTEMQKRALFIDGRLTMEMMEVFAVQWNSEQMETYEKEHLFSNEEAQALDCTTKQSTFGAMGISSLMTATLCNFLTNVKLEMDIRETPFYQRLNYPGMNFTQRDIKSEELCLTETP